MADSKLSNITAADPLADADLHYAVQSGVHKKSTFAAIKTWAKAWLAADNSAFAGVINFAKIPSWAWVDLNGGTALTNGVPYFDAISAIRTLTFTTAAPNGTTAANWCYLRLTVTGTVVLTIPSSIRVGSNSATPITSLTLTAGPHTLVWQYENGAWYLTDTIPSLVDLTAGVTGALPIANGGTASTTAADAFDALNGAETAVSIVAGVANIGAAQSDKVTIGAGTITSFATKTAGVVRRIVFTGAGSITHNATSLICIGSADVAYVAGDMAVMVSLGSGNWRMYNFRPISAILPQLIAEDAFVASGTPSAGTYYAGFIEGTAWNGLSNAARYAIPIDWDASIAAMRVSYFCGGSGDGTHSVTVELLYDGVTVIATDTFFMSATGSFRRSLVTPAANSVAAGHFIEARVTYAASFSGPTGVVMFIKWWYKR